jgi:hypothetical protein
MYVLQREIGPTIYTKIIIELPMPFVGGIRNQAFRLPKIRVSLVAQVSMRKAQQRNPRSP